MSVIKANNNNSLGSSIMHDAYCYLRTHSGCRMVSRHSGTILNGSFSFTKFSHRGGMINESTYQYLYEAYSYFHLKNLMSLIYYNDIIIRSWWGKRGGGAKAAPDINKTHQIFLNCHFVNQNSFSSPIMSRHIRW